MPLNEQDFDSYGILFDVRVGDSLDSIKGVVKGLASTDEFAKKVQGSLLDVKDVLHAMPNKAQGLEWIAKGGDDLIRFSRGAQVAAQQVKALADRAKEHAQQISALDLSPSERQSRQKAFVADLVNQAAAMRDAAQREEAAQNRIAAQRRTEQNLPTRVERAPLLPHERPALSEILRSNPNDQLAEFKARNNALRRVIEELGAYKPEIRLATINDEIGSRMATFLRTQTGQMLSSAGRVPETSGAARNEIARIEAQSNSAARQVSDFIATLHRSSQSPENNSLGQKLQSALGAYQRVSAAGGDVSRDPDARLGRILDRAKNVYARQEENLRLAEAHTAQIEAAQAQMTASFSRMSGTMQPGRRTPRILEQFPQGFKPMDVVVDVEAMGSRDKGIAPGQTHHREFDQDQFRNILQKNAYEHSPYFQEHTNDAILQIAATGLPGFRRGQFAKPFQPGEGWTDATGRFHPISNEIFSPKVIEKAEQLGTRPEHEILADFHGELQSAIDRKKQAGLGALQYGAWNAPWDIGLTTTGLFRSSPQGAQQVRDFHARNAGTLEMRGAEDPFLAFMALHAQLNPAEASKFLPPTPEGHLPQSIADFRRLPGWSLGNVAEASGVIQNRAALHLADTDAPVAQLTSNLYASMFNEAASQYAATGQVDFNAIVSKHAGKTIDMARLGSNVYGQKPAGAPPLKTREDLMTRGALQGVEVFDPKLRYANAESGRADVGRGFSEEVARARNVLALRFKTFSDIADNAGERLNLTNKQYNQTIRGKRGVQTDVEGRPLGEDFQQLERDDDAAALRRYELQGPVGRSGGGKGSAKAIPTDEFRERSPEEDRAIMQQRVSAQAAMRHIAGALYGPGASPVQAIAVMRQLEQATRKITTDTGTSLTVDPETQIKRLYSRVILPERRNRADIAAREARIREVVERDHPFGYEPPLLYPGQVTNPRLTGEARALRDRAAQEVDSKPMTAEGRRISDFYDKVLGRIESSLNARLARLPQGSDAAAYQMRQQAEELSDRARLRQLNNVYAAEHGGQRVVEVQQQTERASAAALQEILAARETARQSAFRERFKAGSIDELRNSIDADARLTPQQRSAKRNQLDRQYAEHLEEFDKTTEANDARAERVNRITQEAKLRRVAQADETRRVEQEKTDAIRAAAGLPKSSRDQLLSTAIDPATAEIRDIRAKMSRALDEIVAQTPVDAKVEQAYADRIRKINTDLTAGVDSAHREISDQMQRDAKLGELEKQAGSQRKAAGEERLRQIYESEGVRQKLSDVARAVRAEEDKTRSAHEERQQERIVRDFASQFGKVPRADLEGKLSGDPRRTAAQRASDVEALNKLYDQYKSSGGVDYDPERVRAERVAEARRQADARMAAEQERNAARIKRKAEFDAASAQILSGGGPAATISGFTPDQLRASLGRGQKTVEETRNALDIGTAKGPLHFPTPHDEMDPRAARANVAAARSAYVFDIDKTLLSGADAPRGIPEFQAWAQKAQAQVIAVGKALYDEAIAGGHEVHMITARGGALRQATIKNLEAAGMGKFTSLSMPPNPQGFETYDQVALFKAGIRRNLEGSGVHVVKNVGDAETDFRHGWFQHGVKIEGEQTAVPFQAATENVTSVAPTYISRAKALAAEILNVTDTALGRLERSRVGGTLGMHGGSPFGPDARIEQLKAEYRRRFGASGTGFGMAMENMAGARGINPFTPPEGYNPGYARMLALENRQRPGVNQIAAQEELDIQKAAVTKELMQARQALRERALTTGKTALTVAREEGGDAVIAKIVETNQRVERASAAADLRRVKFERDLAGIDKAQKALEKKESETAKKPVTSADRLVEEAENQKERTRLDSGRTVIEAQLKQIIPTLAAQAEQIRAKGAFVKLDPNGQPLVDTAGIPQIGGAFAERYAKKFGDAGTAVAAQKKLEEETIASRERTNQRLNQLDTALDGRIQTRRNSALAKEQEYNEKVYASRAAYQAKSLADVERLFTRKNETLHETLMRTVEGEGFPEARAIQEESARVAQLGAAQRFAPNATETESRAYQQYSRQVEQVNRALGKERAKVTDTREAGMTRLALLQMHAAAVPEEFQDQAQRLLLANQIRLREKVGQRPAAATEEAPAHPGFGMLGALAESEAAAMSKVNQAHAAYVQNLQREREAEMHSNRGEVANSMFQMSMQLAVAATAVKGLIINMVEYSARTETMKVVTEQMARVNGINVDAVNNQVTAIKNLRITTQDAHETVQRMMFAELDLGKATQLARVAQDAAVVSGKNSSETLTSIVTGIVTGQTRILHSMGLQVSMQQVLRQLRTDLGREPTEVERRQAMLNAVLSEGVKIQGNYEAAMLTAGKQMTSLKRQFQEAENAIGHQFQPAFTSVLDMMASFANFARENADSVAIFVRALSGLTAAFIALKTITMTQSILGGEGGLFTQIGKLAGVRYVAAGGEEALAAGVGARGLGKLWSMTPWGKRGLATAMAGAGASAGAAGEAAVAGGEAALGGGIAGAAGNVAAAEGTGGLVALVSGVGASILGISAAIGLLTYVLSGSSPMSGALGKVSAIKNQQDLDIHTLEEQHLTGEIDDKSYEEAISRFYKQNRMLLSKAKQEVADVWIDQARQGTLTVQQFSEDMKRVDSKGFFDSFVTEIPLLMKSIATAITWPIKDNDFKRAGMTFGEYVSGNVPGSSGDPNKARQVEFSRIREQILGAGDQVTAAGPISARENVTRFDRWVKRYNQLSSSREDSMVNTALMLEQESTNLTDRMQSDLSKSKTKLEALFERLVEKTLTDPVEKVRSEMQSELAKNDVRNTEEYKAAIKDLRLLGMDSPANSAAYAKYSQLRSADEALGISDHDKQALQMVLDARVEDRPDRVKFGNQPEISLEQAINQRGLGDVANRVAQHVRYQDQIQSLEEGTPGLKQRYAIESQVKERDEAREKINKAYQMVLDQEILTRTQKREGKVNEFGISFAQLNVQPGLAAERAAIESTFQSKYSLEMAHHLERVENIRKAVAATAELRKNESEYDAQIDLTNRLNDETLSTNEKLEDIANARVLSQEQINERLRQSALNIDVGRLDDQLQIQEAIVKAQFSGDSQRLNAATKLRDLEIAAARDKSIAKHNDPSQDEDAIRATDAANLKFELEKVAIAESAVSKARSAAESLIELNFKKESELAKGRAFGPLEELAASRQVYESKKKQIEALAEFERKAAGERKDEAEIAAQRDRRMREAELEFLTQRMNAAKKVRENNEKLGGDVFDALWGRAHGQTDAIRQMFEKMIKGTGETLFKNAWNLTLNGPHGLLGKMGDKFTLPGQGTIDKPSFLGRLLQGTPFGLKDHPEADVDKYLRSHSTLAESNTALIAALERLRVAVAAVDALRPPDKDAAKSVFKAPEFPLTVPQPKHVETVSSPLPETLSSQPSPKGMRVDSDGVMTFDLDAIGKLRGIGPGSYKPLDPNNLTVDLNQGLPGMLRPNIPLPFAPGSPEAASFRTSPWRSLWNAPGEMFSGIPNMFSGMPSLFTPPRPNLFNLPSRKAWDNLNLLPGLPGQVAEKSDVPDLIQGAGAIPASLPLGRTRADAELRARRGRNPDAFTVLDSRPVYSYNDPSAHEGGEHLPGIPGVLVNRAYTKDMYAQQKTIGHELIHDAAEPVLSDLVADPTLRKSLKKIQEGLTTAHPGLYDNAGPENVMTEALAYSATGGGLSVPGMTVRESREFVDRAKLLASKNKHQEFVDTYDKVANSMGGSVRPPSDTEKRLYGDGSAPVKPLSWYEQAKAALGMKADVPEFKVDIPKFAPGKTTEQLAYTNRNPGNLEFRGQPGAVQNGRWAKFTTNEAGYAALQDDIRYKIKKNPNETLSGMITAYAPPSENDTAAYIKNATAALGVPANTPISKIDVDKLAQFQIRQESGASISGTPPIAATATRTPAPIQLPIPPTVPLYSPAPLPPAYVIPADNAAGASSEIARMALSTAHPNSPGQDIAAGVGTAAAGMKIFGVKSPSIQGLSKIESAMAATHPYGAAGINSNSVTLMDSIKTILNHRDISNYKKLSAMDPEELSDKQQSQLSKLDQKYGVDPYADAMRPGGARTPPPQKRVGKQDSNVRSERQDAEDRFGRGLGALQTGLGKLTSIFTGGKSKPSDDGGQSTSESSGSTPDSEDPDVPSESGIDAVNTSAGAKTESSEGSNAGGGLAKAGGIATEGVAAAMLGFNAYKSFQRGGARGDIGGMSNLLTAAAMIPSPASPFLAAGGAMLGIVQGFMGDPRATYKKALDKRLKQMRYEEPDAIETTMDTSGKLVDFNMLGQVRQGGMIESGPMSSLTDIEYQHLLAANQGRQFSASPMPGLFGLSGVINPNVPGGELSYANTVASSQQQQASASSSRPGQTTQLQINVQTMDSRSFNENADKIANSMRIAMLNNHPIVNDVRQVAQA